MQAQVRLCDCGITVTHYFLVATFLSLHGHVGTCSAFFCDLVRTDRPHGFVTRHPYCEAILYMCMVANMNFVSKHMHSRSMTNSQDITWQLAPSWEIDAQAERAAADTFRRSDHLGILFLCAC